MRGFRINIGYSLPHVCVSSFLCGSLAVLWSPFMFHWSRYVLSIIFLPSLLEPVCFLYNPAYRETPTERNQQNKKKH